MKINIFAIIVFMFVVIITIKIYNESDMFQLKCIISDVDGNKYCVRERDKLELVADLLAKVTINMKKLVAHMKDEYPGRKNVQRLVNNFNPKKYTKHYQQVNILLILKIRERS